MMSLRGSMRESHSGKLDYLGKGIWVQVYRKKPNRARNRRFALNLYDIMTRQMLLRLHMSFQRQLVWMIAIPIL